MKGLPLDSSNTARPARKFWLATAGLSVLLFLLVFINGNYRWWSWQGPIDGCNTAISTANDVLHRLLAAWLPETVPVAEPEHGSDASMKPTAHDASQLSFKLRHILHHGTGSSYRTTKRLDITPQYLQQHRQFFRDLVTKNLNRPDFNVADSSNLEAIYNQHDWPEAFAHENPFSINLPVKLAPKKNKILRIKDRHEPNFINGYLTFVRENQKNSKLINLIDLEWEESDVFVPNISNKDTLVSLALMSSNAYVRFPVDDKEKEKSDWRDIIGWIPDEDHEDINFGWDDIGVRGHVFVSEDNSTVVIGIKGTSGAGLPGGGSDETGGNDKTNDNLLFSCCCARVGYMWNTVCDCYDSTYTCDQDCLEKELVREDRYYQAVLQLYNNVTQIYPPDKYNYWVTGHSLGGSLASLLGRTYGIPAVAFEAPGELLATKRLHLPQPPGLPKYMENIWHIGNTADPIFMGVCNGASSSCNIAGYAMETACHTGLQCVYDVVNDLGWRVNLLNHRIHTVIDEIILKYNDTPTCIELPPCRDCFNWRFISRDDDEDDEPWLPNPLDPHRTKTTTKTKTHTHSKSLSTSSSSSTTPPEPTETPDDPPKKCLERTWYGWCVRWGYDDDEPE